MDDIDALSRFSGGADHEERQAMKQGGPASPLRVRYWQWRSAVSKRMERKKFILDHRGDARLCNICGWKGSEFHPLGELPDVLCPACDSQRRHRLLKVVLDRLNLPQPVARILHVAPKGEDGLVRLFKRVAGRYLSIDKGGPWNSVPIAMKAMDLTELELPDNSVDFVQCCHVLENIADDQKAIGEIYRVLAAGGYAALQVQIYGKTTVRVATPSADDHWHAWQPGPDYFERYEKAGFEVQLFDTSIANETLLATGNDLLVPLCRKPGGSRD